MSTNPTDGATEISLNSMASATFSEEMDPATVTSETFTMRSSLGPVAGAVAYSGVTATFNPSAALAPDTLYTATITTGVESRAGVSVAAGRVWHFTTGALPDTVAPEITATSPESGAIDVAFDTAITATFSEAMNPLTINPASFTLTDGTRFVDGTISFSGVTATFTPATELEPETLYTLMISMEATDLAGNALAADFDWTFTTGVVPEIDVPTVVSTLPEDATIDVPIGSDLAATFSEAMDPSTINTGSFTVSLGVVPVSGTVTYSAKTAIFSPNIDLMPESLYTATISAVATDEAGNGLTEDYTWTFTTGNPTEVTVPTVNSTDPSDGAQQVSVNKVISVNFSEAMDPSKISDATFTLANGATPVTGTITYVGVIAVFSPAAELDANTIYTATITTGAEDLAGTPLAEDFVWTFTTGDTPDTIAPVVSSTIPASGATSVTINTSLSASFSEAMDPLNITPASFTLRQDTTAVLGTVTYSGVTAVFNPVADLAPNTTYTAAITIEATDLAGNALEADFEWSFTTGDATDITEPTVSLTDPLDGATEVALNKSIAGTFNEAMDPLTITTDTFLLNDETGPVIGTVTYVGVNAVFNPSIDLAANTLYTATITAGAEDLSGSALAGDYVWTFTTGDTPDITAPTVSFVDPLNGAIDVPINTSLAANFSEAMGPLTITPASFTLRQGTTAVLGTVTYSGVIAVFNPVADLAPNTAYTAAITIEATDLAGNALEADFEWSFTTGDATDITDPLVSLTDPADGAADVAPNQNLAATFNEAMDPLTVTTETFLLNDETGPVIGTVTYAGVIAIFNPAIDLKPNTLYTATITTGTEDLAGSALAEDHVWTFTTGDTLDTIAPMVSFVDPVSGSIDVPINTRLSVTFTEAMAPLSVSSATIDLRQGTTPVLGTVTYSGVTAVFTPVADLDASTVYTAAVRTEATDLAGNAVPEVFEWSFTTGSTADEVAPVVISTNPADAATGIPVNASLAASFSEAMNPGTIDVVTFILNDGAAPVPGAVSYGGAIATFTPTATLMPGTLYTATITTGAEDLVGNALAADFVWTFTTGNVIDDATPAVLSSAPVDGAVGVPINKAASVEFSEAMDQSTISTATFALSDGLNPIVGTVEYANGVATFAPITDLTPNTEYTATVTMAASDLAGNPLAENFTWVFTTGVTTAQDTLDFGTADAFAILAGSNVNNTGPTTITGDLGVSPGTAVTGFPPGILIGTLFTGVGSAAGQAKVDLTTAFTEAAGRSTGSVSLPGDLSGLTLFPGLYTNSTSVMLSSGNLTLDAQGDENAVFLFQMGSTLTTGSTTQVVLTGGAKANNVYWQVGSSATLGTTSMFAGNILAETSITLSTGAVLEGRALTNSAAVSLDSATITAPTP